MMLYELGGWYFVCIYGGISADCVQAIIEVVLRSLVQGV